MKKMKELKKLKNLKLFKFNNFSYRTWIKCCFSKSEKAYLCFRVDKAGIFDFFRGDIEIYPVENGK